MRRMAVRFLGELDELLADIARGGFGVRAICPIPEARGRNADIFLNNGAIVSWDAAGRVIWVDGAVGPARQMEFFFKNLYERTWLPRRLSVAGGRIQSWRQGRTQTVAIWLLRSESAPARFIRRRIEQGPGGLLAAATLVFRRKKTVSAL